MPTIVHFEIPADDIERSKKFYSDLFGWKIERWPGPVRGRDMEYWMVTTTDEKGNKALGDGMMERNASRTSDYQLHRCKIGRRILVEGAEIRRESSSVPKMAVPGMGYLAILS